METENNNAAETDQDHQESSQQSNSAKDSIEPAKSSSAPADASRRPWQGTTLGVLQIIGPVIIGLTTIGVLLLAAVGSKMMATYLDDLVIREIMEEVGIFIFLIFAGLVVLYIFVIRGIFRGSQWAIIASLILSVLGVLGSLSKEGSLFVITWSGFMIYLEIVCLKHPFYKSKKS